MGTIKSLESALPPATGVSLSQRQGDDGDVNILPTHFHGEDTTHIHLRLGASLVSVPRDRLLGGQHRGGRMDIYIRPEDIRFEPLSASSILTGTVVSHVLRRDHVDSHVNVDIAVKGAQRVLVRSAEQDVITLLPVGTVTALALHTGNVIIIPEATI